MKNYIKLTIIFLSILKGEIVFPTLDDDYAEVLRKINYPESKEHNDFLIKMLDFSVSKGRSINKPVPTRAQIKLFERFRNAGYPRPMIGNEPEWLERNKSNANQWLKLNYSKIAYNENGTHYFNTPPIGVDHMTGEIIPIESSEQKEEVFRETK